MSLRILQGHSMISSARRELENRRLSSVPRWPWRSILAILRLGRLFSGDYVKSWDVWQTAMLLEDHCDTTDAIVDFGAYKSEILEVLLRMGYTSLHGIDLNPALVSSPLRDRIQYTVGDFFATGFPDNSFAAVTSISAIEHGLDVGRLLREVARVLKPGGLFVCSTDYWPEKIDTSGVNVLGMPWTIFSERELAGVIEHAMSLGLRPLGDLNYKASEKVIRHAGRAYTFAWFALRKIA